MRGYMGDLGMDLDPSVGARGRNGAWNDDSRNAGTMLYPICQSTIPQSEMSPTGRHMWGNGMSSSFNLRVCIQASDTLFFQVSRLPAIFFLDRLPASGLHVTPVSLQAVAETQVNEFRRTIACGFNTVATGKQLEPVLPAQRTTKVSLM
eukprot:COSAG02_NODE_1029_length_15083_cov_8.066271_11_plen_149_part_00